MRRGSRLATRRGRASISRATSSTRSGTTPSLHARHNTPHVALNCACVLTSGVGALVLGIGLGALLGKVLGGFGLPLLIAGALVHGWGMFDKHRLEQRAGVPDVRWHVIAYWACWLLLALMALG